MVEKFALPLSLWISLQLLNEGHTTPTGQVTIRLNQIVIYDPNNNNHNNNLLNIGDSST